MRYYLLIAAILITGLSCKKSSNSGNCGEPELDCATVNCLIYSSLFDFKVVDKSTGADLVFGTNPRYSANDVELFTDASFSRPLQLAVDLAGKKFSTDAAAEEMYLRIQGTTVYKISASLKNVDCCTTRIRDLNIDNRSVCVCCSDVIGLPVN